MSAQALHRMEFPALAKFDPLPRQPTNAHLARGQEQLHECIEEGKRQHEAGTLILSSRIESIGGQVAALDGRIPPVIAQVIQNIGRLDGIADNINDIQNNQLKVAADLISATDRVAATAKQVETTAATVARYEKTLKAVQDFLAKFGKWLGLIVATALGTIIVGIVVTAYNTSIHTATLNGAYTTQQATADRAAQDKINQAILAKLNATK